MHRLRYAGIHLPEIWVCDPSEADAMRERGVPFIATKWPDEKVIKHILYAYLGHKFPFIDWTMVFGKVKTTVKVEVPSGYREDYESEGGWYDDDAESYMQYTADGGYRESGGGNDHECDRSKEIKFDEFFTPHDMTVDIEVLQKMKLLPVFLDDIASAIKSNLANVQWMDGWNKKLGMPTGYYSGGAEAPNLIILDVSGSIPNGVAVSMVALIETLRSQANADLIVTSSYSEWYPKDEPCPTPEQLAYLVGGGNESKQFHKILNDHVLGRHWGNVIVFGDQDCPDNYGWRGDDTGLDPAALASTQVDNLLCFHTYNDHQTPGYGRWVHGTKHGPETIDITWVDGMKVKPSARRWLSSMRIGYGSR